jgi:hypothetical protein
LVMMPSTPLAKAIPEIMMSSTLIGVLLLYRSPRAVLALSAALLSKAYRGR